MIRLSTIGWAALAVAGLLVSGNRAEAGWIVLSNDTSLVLVVQDAPETGNLPKRLKTVRLLPGEVYREFQPGEGKKSVLVFDSRHPMKPMFRGTVTWTADDLRLTLEPDGLSVRLGPTTTARR